MESEKEGLFKNEDWWSVWIGLFIFIHPLHKRPSGCK